jgi:hypothetical protein
VEGASRKLQQQPVKAGGCSTCRVEGSESGVSRQLIAGLAGGRIVRRKPDGSPSVDRKCGTVGASRRFATGRAERNHTDPSRGSRPPVEPECGAVGASRKFRAGAASGRSGSASCRFAAGVAGGRDSRLYYEIIKIETPEASVSGVFNLCPFFGRLPACFSIPSAAPACGMRLNAFRSSGCTGAVAFTLNAENPT